MNNTNPAVAVSSLATSAGVLALVAPSLIGLPDAIGALGAAVIVFGAWVFVDDGEHRITAAGVYCLTAGLSIGAACLYYRTVDPAPVTRNDIYHAAIWAFLATVAMYAGWWLRRRRTLPPNRPPLVSGMTGYARTVGFVLLVVGLGMQYGHISNITLDSAATFDGSVMLGASFLLGDSGRRRPAPWRVAACGAALGIYVVTQFTGGGRLVLVSLGFATVFLAQDRIHHRHLKRAIIVAVVPALIVFGYVGRSRIPADPTQQQASGLSSVVTPLDNFATEIQDGLNHGGPKPLIGDIIFPIPRAVWHAKPPPFGQTLAEYLTGNPVNSVAALNQGEWYYIDGWAGLVIMVFVTGFVVAWLDTRLRRRHGRRFTERRAFLGLVALSVLAGGLPDLAWAGTSTWSARAIPRLLVLAPFWLLAVVTQRTRNLQPTPQVTADG